jgi:hypothetical protein
LGTVTQATDSFYEFTATGSLTLPKYPENGAVYTIKNKSSATVTINANTTGISQTVGTTTSTAFLLYAAEDYVTLRYSLSDTTWYVVATNGPVVSANQSGSGNLSTAGAWTAFGNGLTLGTLTPGVYDLELCANILTGPSGNVLAVTIGNATTPIASREGIVNNLSSVLPVVLHATIKNYVLSASATIQALYYAASNAIPSISVYNATYQIGAITARRIG